MRTGRKPRRLNAACLGGLTNRGPETYASICTLGVVRSGGGMPEFHRVGRSGSGNMGHRSLNSITGKSKF